jgi:L-ascorbate metabolism protein UlaG (beta-lactamase superfamily)
MAAQPTIDNLTWLGHDCFKIVGGGQVIYVDPFQLKPPQEPADLILITHEHFDHCSPNDFKTVMKPTTMTVASAVCGPDLLTGRLIIVRPGDRHEFEGVTVEAVPAYNLNKTFHPQEDPRVGFIISLEGQRLYHAGDTDFIPEMKKLKNIDVALVPVSGTYVMTAAEAAEAVNAFKPKLAIPMHYGSIVGSREDAERFKQLAKVPVTILEPAG